MLLAATLVASPSLAQPYYEGATTPQPSFRKDADNRAARARTQRRILAEEAKRRYGTRITDPRETATERIYPNGRLTNGAGTYSLPVPSTGNRAVLVPQH